MAAHPRHPHLPAGREPVPQSLRRKGNRRFGIAFFLAFAVAGIVVSALFLGGQIENDDPDTTGVILLILSVFFALLALLIWRLGSRSTGLGHLELTPAESELSRGETLHTRLRIVDTAKMAAKTEVGLVCVEYYDALVSTGKGTQRTTHEAVAWQSWRPVDSAQPVQEFEFELPAHLPFSHEGDAISFAWRVSAREDRRARRDPRTDEPIWVHS